MLEEIAKQIYRGGGKKGRVEEVPTKQFYSQAYLLDLKRGCDHDDGCPNVLAHRVASGGGLRHPATANEFIHLVDR